MAEEIEKELGWNDEIGGADEKGEFVLLEPGEYAFQVKTFERSRFAGSAKVIACNMAVLGIAILDEAGNELAFIKKHNLLLTSRLQWMTESFFRSIGAKKHGETIKMDWNQVIGSRGRCVIEIKELDSTKKPGEKFKINQIKRFLDPVEVPFDGQF